MCPRIRSGPISLKTPRLVDHLWQMNLERLWTPASGRLKSLSRRWTFTLLFFPDLSGFIAGQLQAHPGVWDWIAESSSYPFRSTVLYLVKNKVDVHDYFRLFIGSLKGESFDSDLPSPRVFRNHPSCETFPELISQSIKQRLATGVISVWGRVGECKPLHQVLPLRVEPTKPSFCTDNKFLNLWVQDRPFSLDYLYPLPFYNEKDTYQTVCDVKLGYNSNNNNNSLILVVRKDHFS